MVRERKYLGAETNAPVSIICNCCCKRCARKRQRRCLPPEIIFNILLHLPALVIRDVMRHVCREWNLMIRSPYFIHHHLRNSIGGIIIQPLFLAGKSTYVVMRRGCLEISEFDCGFAYAIRTSCNGLTLIPDSRDIYTLYVINPLMKQRTALPPFPHTVDIHSEFKLAFVEASMEYKVVNARGPKPLNPPKQIAMLTIGVDRVWRHIDVQHLPLTARTALTTFPLVTGGYVHWIGETFVLTLSAETETFCEFPMPQLERGFRKFLPMDGNLSVVYCSNELSRDVWEMDSETGEWTMLLSFDLKPLLHRFKDLFSNEKSVTYLGWLAVREVLVLSTICFQRHCIAYNVKTGEIQSFELGTDCSNTKPKVYNFVAHKNSLVCLEGGF
ncbi:F-box protein At5g07610-like [Henckelia pumila]|uniref:F-box protein At5g07610-like n=1 Tax=Henckelia pumila TaxID=405737 RepID=UPI003C6DFBD7